jgi:prepilin signal peptidase PulO-like enzyme (type II secretory pathway)
MHPLKSVDDPQPVIGYLKNALIAATVGVVIAILIWPICPGLALALPFLAAGAARDMWDGYLPDDMTLPAIGLACVGAMIAGTQAEAVNGITAAFILGSVMRVIRPNGIYYGDIKALAAIGAAGGFTLFFMTFIIFSSSAVIYHVIRTRKASGEVRGGPWIVGGSIAAVLSQVALSHFGVHPQSFLPFR